MTRIAFMLFLTGALCAPAYADDSRPSRGDPQALVTIELYGDFLYAPSVALYTKARAIVDQNPDKVRAVFYHAPDFQAVGRENSLIAAFAAECAFQAGKFWEYADVLARRFVEAQKDIRVFTEFAVEAGIVDETGAADPSFVECYTAHDRGAVRAIKADLARAQERKITAGDTFVNSRKVPNPLEMRSMVLEEYTKARLPAVRPETPVEGSMSGAVPADCVPKEFELYPGDFIARIGKKSYRRFFVTPKARVRVIYECPVPQTPESEINLIPTEEDIGPVQ